MDKLISFHKNKLGAYNLVFKHFKWRWRLFKFILIITAVNAVLLLTLVNGSKLKWNEDPVYIFIPLFCFTFLYFLYINGKAKKIIRKKYNITSKTFIWRDQSFEELQIDLVYKYLNENKLLNESKIELIRELINKEAERKKKTGLLWPGVALAVFIPLWTQIIGWAYKQATTPQDIVNTTGTLIIVIIYLLIIAAIVKKINEEISNEFFNRESQRLYGLLRILDNILLKL